MVLFSNSGYIITGGEWHKIIFNLFLIYFYFLLSFILPPNNIAILTLGIYICVWRISHIISISDFTPISRRENVSHSPPPRLGKDKLLFSMLGYIYVSGEYHILYIYQRLCPNLLNHGWERFAVLLPWLYIPVLRIAPFGCWRPSY